MRIKVIQPFIWEGTHYKRIGEELEVWDSHARRWIMQGWAIDMKGNFKPIIKKNKKKGK